MGKENPTYIWSGLNRENQDCMGMIKSGSLREAKLELLARDIRIERIRRKRNAVLRLSENIKPDEIIFISRQLAVMISVGIPLSQALFGIAKGSKNRHLTRMLNSIKTEVESGTNLSTAMSSHPDHFDQLYIGMIRTGEASGALDKIMDQLATHLEKTNQLKAKIKSALIYPLIVMAIAAIVLAILMIIIIPEFEMLFLGFGKQLPALTEHVIAASLVIRQYGVFVIALLTLSYYFANFIYRRFSAFQIKVDQLTLRIPISGTLQRKSITARITSTLSLMIGAGVPLTNALNTIANATGNQVYTDGLIGIKDQIENGKSLSSSMKESHLFPSMALQMIATGEESGELEKMLEKISEFHENEIDTIIESIGQLVEPLLIIIIGCVVGIIVVAMYLPVFQSGAVFA